MDDHSLAAVRRAAADPAPVAAQAGAGRLDELHAQQPAELPLVHSAPPPGASGGPRGGAAELDAMGHPTASVPSAAG